MQIPTMPRNLVCSQKDFGIDPTSDWSEATVGFVEGLGFKALSKGEPDGWVRIIENVDPHSDNSGKTFIACMRGFGIMQCEGREVPFGSGFYMTFDDRQPHGFILMSKDAVFLIFSVSGKSVKQPTLFDNSLRLSEHFLA